MRYVYRRYTKPPQMRYVYESNTRNRLRFIQIPSKRLKKDTRTQENNKVFGLSVAQVSCLFKVVSFEINSAEQVIKCIKKYNTINFVG